MPKKLKNISILGTSSDAGKSTLTFAIAKILQDLGYKVAPFKAQNVSNNSHVADDGSEIAVAQHFQASVLGIPTSYHINPVLLKSGTKNSASLIVEGKVVTNKDVREYYRDIDTLKPAVKNAFSYLDTKYDCVVCEGAGSPVELNLMDKDLSNVFIACEFDTKIILVADIERGGVFASIWGVYNLLPIQMRQNVIGVIVNKFRGDMSLFDEGVKIIENEFKIPVLGVLPYTPFNLGFEDSASLKNFVQIKPSYTKKVAIINYPTMSNYNDFEPLIADDDILVEFVTSNISLVQFDLVILPGSKLVIKDLKWLKSTGLFAQIQTYKKEILGICGGYEMMFEKIIDDLSIENETPTSEEGLGFIDDNIIFHKEKTLLKGEFEIFGKKVKGFQIRHGQSTKYPLFYEKNNIKGTFVHGIFDDEKFEIHKQKTVNEFVNIVKTQLDVKKILNAL
ncbi:cobyric acid synthase [Arcobacter sp. FWKO B]|uniref:cobyric acid synthase n=1 Tax=Arcobacter sp. FWKO B TaxID=2593672 RepID=UPI0018A38B9A|nr:cobyric acid synthase [Arcobacter sp. FWKO B]QOG12464.1 cobyric acid synthase [Arcobacter sp. FWKO B]